MNNDLFVTFRPDADELLRRLSQLVGDDLLSEIAAANYGYRTEDHLGFLRQIRDRGIVLNPMRWYPREVLELIRWSEPEDLHWKPGLPGEQGHLMRAFACASLLRAAGELENTDLREGWNQTLIQLVDSLRSIGPDLTEPAAAFMAWLIPRAVEFDEEELGFFFIGLLWFALRVQSADHVIVTLAERAITEAERGDQRLWPRPERWLLGTTFADLRHVGWERLGRLFVDIDLAQRSDAVRKLVMRIGKKLSEG